jgi:8-oxo-dGTP pyrophosphatase MutT (NUDIX family)
MTIYSCAFAFAQERPEQVLLIRKAKPEWQRGRLNGIGGKCEDKKDGFMESPLETTVREFYEETGLWGTPIVPKIYHSMLWQEYETHTGWPLVYFSAFTIPFREMQKAAIETSIAVEPCVIINTYKIEQSRHEMMPNLPFLIEMAQCLVICSDKERALRQPVVPDPSSWLEIAENGKDLSR